MHFVAVPPIKLHRRMVKKVPYVGSNTKQAVPQAVDMTIWANGVRYTAISTKWTGSYPKKTSRLCDRGDRNQPSVNCMMQQIPIQSRLWNLSAGWNPCTMCFSKDGHGMVVHLYRELWAETRSYSGDDQLEPWLRYKSYQH